MGNLEKKHISVAVVVYGNVVNFNFCEFTRLRSFFDLSQRSRTCLLSVNIFLKDFF